MDRAVPVSLPSNDAPARGRRRWWLWGSNFLVASILVHVLLGVGAAYLIVQRITAKSKATFAAASAPSAPAAASREHKVQMQKKQQTMSAPAQMKRVTTTAPNTSVALPQMPALPTLSTSLSPARMPGMSGSGTGLAIGGSRAGGGAGPTLFGFRENRGNNALTGTFYDLKQSRNGQPTNMAGSPDPSGPQEGSANDNHRKTVAAFVNAGFNEGALGLFFRGPSPLYTTQVFIPTIDANDGPKSFNLADQVKPRRWLVVYKARVSPPESGRYRFVGAADDYLVVRFNGRTVLDGGIANVTGSHPAKAYNLDGLGGSTPSVREGDASEVTAGNTYPLEILIGELPGGQFRAVLLLEKEGGDYAKDSKGNPLLPVFKVSASPSTSGDGLPLVSADTSWSVWKATPYDAGN